VIFELDENYQYAFVTGSDRTYLWFLSRTPDIDNKLKEHFIKKVSMLGYDTSEIIFVKQN